MKKWYLSKTVWLAVITFLIGGLMALQSSFPEMGWIIMGKAILDLLLRVITKDEVIA